MDIGLPAPCLIVLIGPSGSGKSTWANKTFHDSEIASSDRLRAMVGAGEDAGTRGVPGPCPGMSSTGNSDVFGRCNRRSRRSGRSSQT